MWNKTENCCNFVSPVSWKETWSGIYTHCSICSVINCLQQRSSVSLHSLEYWKMRGNNTITTKIKTEHLYHLWKSFVSWPLAPCNLVPVVSVFLRCHINESRLCDILSQASFTQNNAFGIHPCCTCQCLVLISEWWGQQMSRFILTWIIRSIKWRGKRATDQSTAVWKTTGKTTAHI